MKNYMLFVQSLRIGSERWYHFIKHLDKDHNLLREFYTKHKNLMYNSNEDFNYWGRMKTNQNLIEELLQMGPSLGLVKVDQTLREYSDIIDLIDTFEMEGMLIEGYEEEENLTYRIICDFLSTAKGYYLFCVKSMKIKDNIL